MYEFALPDVGEGLTEAEIVKWHVTEGDVVEINTTLVEIETAKSVVELPSPAAGTITTIHAPEGTTVTVGTVIITIAAPATSAAPDSHTSASTADRTASADHHVDLGGAQGSVPVTTSVLVGTGPRLAVPRRFRLRQRGVRPELDASRSGEASQASRRPVRSKPPVRLLARNLGVDLTALTPSTGDLITRHDVEAAASAIRQPTPGAGSRETRIPIKGVRKATAAAVTQSAFTAPHVTEWLTVDVTRTMNLIKRLKADRNWAEVRLTPLVFVARAFLLAIRRFPDISARWDEGAQEIVIQHYVNLGIAAATPRGLLVPNIKDSQTLDLTGLAHEIDQLVQIARAGKTSPSELAGGTITITNIGALGVDGGTPILNPGESAILAFGAVREMPWVVDGQIVPRQVTQLAMSFDHRLVDGELGSNVLVAVGHLLEDPGDTFLHV